MYMYHTTMANAVRDAITLIEMWEIEEEPVIDIKKSKEINLDQSII